MSESSPVTARRRPRYSLLTTLMLMTIAGMALVIWRQWRVVGPLRDEVLRWRNENGVLTIADRSKVHLIISPLLEEVTWHWRIYVPPGRRIELYKQSGVLPPKDTFDVTLAQRWRAWKTGDQPQELEFTVGVRDGENRPAYLAILHDNGGRETIRMPSDSGSRSVSVPDSAFRRTLTLEVGQTLELIRLSKLDDPEGAAVWLKVEE